MYMSWRSKSNTEASTRLENDRCAGGLISEEAISIMKIKRAEPMISVLHVYFAYGPGLVPAHALAPYPARPLSGGCVLHQALAAPAA